MLRFLGKCYSGPQLRNFLPPEPAAEAQIVPAGQTFKCTPTAVNAAAAEATNATDAALQAAVNDVAAAQNAVSPEGATAVRESIEERRAAGELPPEGRTDNYDVNNDAGE